jgi:hypothetical protein
MDEKTFLLRYVVCPLKDTSTPSGTGIGNVPSSLRSLFSLRHHRRAPLLKSYYYLLLLLFFYYFFFTQPPPISYRFTIYMLIKLI